MSRMQSFRDGGNQRQRVEQIRAYVRIVFNFATIGCMAFAVIFACRGQFDQATFYAVLAMWGQRK